MLKPLVMHRRPCILVHNIVVGVDLLLVLRPVVVFILLFSAVAKVTVHRFVAVSD
jgi:hypothetical protein